MDHFLNEICLIPKDNVILLLQLILNNCAFSPGKFCDQLQGAAMEYHILCDCKHLYELFWTACVKSRMSHTLPMVKKCGQCPQWWSKPPLFNHLNALDSHTEITMESPGNKAPFLL